jgi:hypothetical protein
MHVLMFLFIWCFVVLVPQNRWYPLWRWSWCSSSSSSGSTYWTSWCQSVCIAQRLAHFPQYREPWGTPLCYNRVFFAICTENFAPIENFYCFLFV